MEKHNFLGLSSQHTQYIHLYLYIKCLTYLHISKHFATRNNNTLQCISRLRAVSCVRRRDGCITERLSNRHQHAITTMCRLTAGLPFSHFSTSPFSRWQEVKARLVKYCVVHVHVKYMLISTKHLKSLVVSLDLHLFDLEDVRPRVSAEAVLLASLAAQTLQWV